MASRVAQRLPEILDSQPMYFVGSLTPDPHAAASIVPDKRTIWLYDSFFEGCRTPEDIELRTWMRFCCEYRRALLIIHELIHFKSHQWWSALCLRIDDPRFNTLGKKRGLTLVHDMGIAISKVPGACTWENFDAEIEPNTLGFSRREKKDLENTPPQTTEQVRIDGYESRGARILARSIEGDIGALLNADSYTELAGRAFMAHHMSLYRRRLSVPLLKNGVKEQEKTRRQSMFEWLRQ